MILVAVGANLDSIYGAPLNACQQAVRLLVDEKMEVLSLSRWYETAPVPMSDQPWYVNGVALVRSSLSAEECLSGLHRIEDRMGRVRTVVNAPRVIDLDLLAHGGDVRENASLSLPHPRLQERAFVLYPLRDVAPDWVHPRLGLSVDQMMASLPPDQQIRPLLHD